MKKIDRETIQRILDAADIVEVVSDFVRLKKRGVNYIGLCPFHAERTPSFSVSKSRNICKCFSCGKGGSPVHFVMEHEALSYFDALRYLAKKYNIEVKEHEVSEEEKEADRQRESMFAINEWAARKYVSYLYDTKTGVDIGLSYFRERGLNDSTIQKFKLGYSPDKHILADDATREGYDTKYLVDTGICYRRERSNELIDRFNGRVIFPVFTVSGKVVAFGGRTLSSAKDVAKYVNSPESSIYSKSSELYGLFQAKTAIVKKGYCLLVEGYMDVLSMSQSGIENVVASSGTSLTEGQIRLLHRFTDKVTLMYDSDAAGIKAAIRGVDLLLAEGLDISIVLLPEGEDPDSFAQSFSSTVVEDYINDKAEDFIRFKTRILLGEAKEDPIKRSEVIGAIVKSIACIPDEIKRLVYCQECSRLLNINEEVLLRQVAIERSKQAEKKEFRNALNRAHESLGNQRQPIAKADSSEPTTLDTPDNSGANMASGRIDVITKKIYGCEEEVLKYIVRYGYAFACDAIDEDGKSVAMNVLEFVENDLAADNITFSNPLHRKLFETALSYYGEWNEEAQRELRELEDTRAKLSLEGIEVIRLEALSLDDIGRREALLKQEIEEKIQQLWFAFSTQFLESRLLSSADADIREIAMRLMQEKHQLSRYHTRFTTLPSEFDKLIDLISTALNTWKYALVEKEIVKVLDQISEAIAENDVEHTSALMHRKVELDQKKSKYALILGERVFSPR